MLVAVVAGAIFFALGLWWLLWPTARVIRVPGMSVFMSVPLVCVAIVSLWYAASSKLPLWGLHLEPGTLGSLALVALVLFISSLFSRRFTQDVFLAYLAVSAAVSLSGTIVYIVAPDIFSLFWVPSWQYVPLIATIALVAAVVWSAQSGYLSPFLICVGCVSALTIMVVPYASAMLGGLTALALLLGLKILFQRSSLLSAGTIALGGGVLLFLALWFLPVHIALPGEVRPSFSASVVVLGNVFTSDTRAVWIGHGPGSFSEVWDLYRPSEVNATAYWNITPTSSGSFMLTLMATLGLLGVAAFLCMPLVFMGVFISRLARPESGVVVSAPVWAMVSVFLVVWSMEIFISLPLALLLVGTAAAGFTARFLYPVRPFAQPLNLLKRIALYVPVCLAGLAIAVMGYHQTKASYLYAQGSDLLQDDPQAAAAYYKQAAQAWDSALYESAVARATLAAAYSAGSENIPPEELAAKLLEVRTYAERSRNSDPRNFDVLLSNAAVYVSLVIAGATDASTDAESMLSQAQGLAPTRPEPYRLYGEMYFALGDYEKADEKVKKSLQLKPDYEDALALKEKIDGILKR